MTSLAAHWPPSVLQARDSLFQRLRRQPPLLLLDFDGTLAPMAARPDLAELPAATAGILRELAGLCTMAVISGRALEDVRRRVGLKGIHYAGNHGLDIDGPGLRWRHASAGAAGHALDAATRDVAAATGDIEGVLLEHKGLGLSVHFRLTPPAQQQAVVQAVTAAAANQPALAVRRGKCVIELYPEVNWHKGDAVRVLRQALDPRHTLLPLYLGDDRTDEDVFRVLASGQAQFRGVGIVVADAPRPTAAQYHLPTPEAVTGFLHDLAGELARNQARQAGSPPPV